MALNDVQMVFTDLAGRPWHTIRFASGSWQSTWDNVNTEVTHPSPLYLSGVGVGSQLA